MSDTARFIRDLILCILFVLAVLGLYSAAAIYLNDPVQPTVPDGAYTDWRNE